MMPKLLVADDNQEMLDTLKRIFVLYEFEVITALNGREAIEKAHEHSPDLIILDGMMPEMDGFDACQILKTDAETRDIPVVFLTANYIELHHRLKGLELGADDYLIKPFNSRELVVRIKSILKRSELTRQLKAENNALLKKNVTIEKQLKQIQNQPDTETGLIVDPETGLYTEHFFREQLKNELDRVQRYKQSMTVARITLRHTQKLQDALGPHLYSLIIIRMANYILKKMRAADIVSLNRESGFYILMPETQQDGARQKVAQLCDDLEKLAYLDDEILSSLQISRKKMNDLTRMTFGSALTEITSEASPVPNVEQVINTLKTDTHCKEKSEK